MPLTVITIKNVPRSLRGDLSKWMQEIATGVYVGNFNTKVREKLWKRVKENVKDGEATLAYAYRNEIGYSFDTINSDRELVDLDGIPFIRLPIKQAEKSYVNKGFSNASKFRKAQKYKSKSFQKNLEKESRYNKCNAYVFIDIETDGLDEEENSIIEIGAYKIEGDNYSEFQYLIEHKIALPRKIIELTGITDEMLSVEGEALDIVLKEFIDFVGDNILIGYNINFDISFINHKLKKLGLSVLKNNTYDLMKYVKKDKMFLDNYKLQTVLQEYGIDQKVPHRALLDSKLTYNLASKVNKFKDVIGVK